MSATYSISESELEIMRIIWGNGGEIRFGPLMQQLGDSGRSWKSNTVLTFLSRLVDKKILAVEKQGRLNLYRSLLTEEEYLEKMAASFVSNVYGGNAKNLVASLLRGECLMREDIRELHEFWEGEKEK